MRWRVGRRCFLQAEFFLTFDLSATGRVGKQMNQTLLLKSANSEAYQLLLGKSNLRRKAASSVRFHQIFLAL